MNRRLHTFVLALPLAWLAACDDSQGDPRSLLQEPRILALRASPPVLSPGAVAVLDGLVVGANGEQRADVELRWRACNPWRFVLDPDVDCAPANALALDDGVLDPLALLERFPPPDGELPDLSTPSEPGSACDEPLRLELPVVAEATVDGRRLLSIKRVPVFAEAADRTNPVLADLMLDGQPADGTYRPDAVYEIGIAPRRDSLDEVCVAGEPAPEAVRVHLYTNAGLFDDASVDVLYLADGSVSAELTSWTAPASGTVTIWLVAIDGDGGVDWRSHTLTPR